MFKAQSYDKIYLIDFGISKIFKESKNQKTGKSFIGTSRYASISAHFGLELSRKDDLESLSYILAYFLRGSLPWQNIQGIDDDDERIKFVGEMK